MERVANLNNTEVLKLISELIDQDIDFEIKISIKHGDTDNTAVVSQREHLEDIVDKMLIDIGISESLLGYNYIKEAAVISASNKYLKNDVVKGIYVPIAERFSSTPSRVERAIRHSIQSAFNKDRNSEYREKLFGHIIDNNKSVPTNSQFLAVITNTIRKRVNSD